ncbi:hypothetical protein CR513_01588, partial [Mucuna pruriens]
MSAPCFGRPIWLVQLSLLEAPAVVRLRTPRSRISHSPSFFSDFIFLSTHSIGRLRADRCLPGEIGAPELLSGVKGRVPFLSCPKTGFILIGERLSRGKVLHIGPAAFFISLAATAIGCFAYLFYYGRLGDIRGRPSFLSGYDHSFIHSLNLGDNH